MQFPKRIRLPHDAYSNPDTIFHVVVSCLPGMKPFADAALGSAIWRVVEGEQTRNAVRVSAACLMPDHFHAVVSPRSKSIIEWMNDLKSYTTRTSKDFRQQRFLWHRSFYDRRLHDLGEYESAVAYVLRNPLGAGLISEEGEWPWVGSWLE